MPITCKHFLDGGLCTCFSTVQKIIRQLYAQITPSIRGSRNSLKMLHAVPQLPFGCSNQTWDLWLKKRKRSSPVAAVAMFSVSHHNGAKSRRSRLHTEQCQGPAVVHPAHGGDGRLICPQTPAAQSAVGHWAGRWHSHRTQTQGTRGDTSIRKACGGTGLWDITVLSALTGAARPSPLGGKNGSCAFWFLLRPKLRDSFLFQPSIAEIAQQVKLLILDRYIGLCAST